MKNIASTYSSIDSQHEKWSSIIEKKSDYLSIAIDFLTGQIRTEFLVEHKDTFFGGNIQEAIETLIHSLEKITIGQLCYALKHCTNLKPVDKSNIPQYSNFATAVICVPEILVKSSEPLSYKALGSELSPESKSDYAIEKYGENHGKLAVALGLAEIKKIAGCNKFYPSALTSPFCHMTQSDKMALLTRLCYRIPFVQQAVVTETPEQKVVESLQKVLAPSTYSRRIANAQEILAFALEK